MTDNKKKDISEKRDAMFAAKNQPMKISVDDFEKKFKPPLLRRIAKKLFDLPSPTELGRSERDSLPSRDFGMDDDDEAYTWEDWREEVKAKYPIKYFLREEVTSWLSVHLAKPVEEAVYWTKSHTYRRYHLLDLRQPKTGTNDDYRYGWADQDSKILYACFNLLIEYYNEGVEGSVFYSVPEFIKNNASSIEFYNKEIENLKAASDLDEEKKQKLKNLEQALEFVKKDHEAYSEIETLYQYWTVDRKNKLKQYDEALSVWAKQNRKTRSSDELHKLEVENDEEETEMLIRLMKVRHYMWH